MHRREQGDRAELGAMEWFAAQGAIVSIPVGHSADYDFIADVGSTIARVQVKSSTFTRNRRFEVATCTRGGNRSWNGIVKRLDAGRFDILFVVVADGRRWSIPAAEVHGRSGILLGGPKYERYEVRRGSPIAA